MALAPDTLPVVTPDGFISRDGRPTPEFRTELRRIASVRNAFTVAFLYVQTCAVIVACCLWQTPLVWIPAFLLMGRAHAQFLSLMHEAAHRLLFRNKTLNDLVGKWLLGYPTFTNTMGYRRVHMAHHREEFGPEEPDIALYANYPITAASLRRKLLRDATGRTGIKLLRDQFRSLRSPSPVVRRTNQKIFLVQIVLIAISFASGYPLVYPLLWLLPYLTVWRVINRLRSIGEHGGLRADPDRRITTHSVRQHWFARFYLVPYNIGFHLAHHTDAGVPWRNLPEYHRHMWAAGYVNDEVEYPSYRSLWKALRTG